MNDVSIIIRGMRFDAVNEEDYRSCKGCDIGKGHTTAGLPVVGTLQKEGYNFQGIR